jgi:hypothetical protein
MAIAKKQQPFNFISTTSAYPWQVALQQSRFRFA